MVQLEVAYGKSKVTFAVPAANWRGEVVPKHDPPIRDIPAAIKQAVNNPIGSAPLKEVVHAGESVAVVVSSWDRLWQKQHTWVPSVVNEINACGVPDSQIKIVLAAGTLRPHTDEEISEIVGEDLRRRVTVIDHNSRDNYSMDFLGTTSHGVDVWVNRHVSRADRKILTGGVIPYASVGFRGGRKSVLPGISSLYTIEGNHRLRRRPDHVVALGQTAGNLVHEDMVEIASFLKPDFLVNVTPDADWNPVHFYAGHFLKAWEEGCKYAAEHDILDLEEGADIVIAGVGGNLCDRDLYHHSLAYGPALRPLKSGGVLIMVAQCPNGLGPRDFPKGFDLPYEEHKRIVDSYTLHDCTMADAALGVRTTARTNTVVLLSDIEPSLVRKVGLVPARTPEEALSYALAQKGPNATVLALRNALVTYCRIKAPVPAGA